jgi:hypothetical protein
MWRRYDMFGVGNRASGYRLAILGEYSGTAGKLSNGVADLFLFGRHLEIILFPFPLNAAQ